MESRRAGSQLGRIAPRRKVAERVAEAGTVPDISLDSTPSRLRSSRTRASGIPFSAFYVTYSGYYCPIRFSIKIQCRTWIAALLLYPDAEIQSAEWLAFGRRYMNRTDPFKRLLASLNDAALDDALWPATSSLIDET